MHSRTLQSQRQATNEPTPAQPQSGLTARGRPDVRGPPGPHESAIPQSALSKAQLARGIGQRPKARGVQGSLNWGRPETNSNLQVAV
eukprot:7952451-Pyramimonas_sp.AAC.1